MMPLKPALYSSYGAATICLAGLTTWQSWRINHPQPMTTKDNSAHPHFYQAASIRLVSPVLGVWVGSQRKRPQLRPCPLWRWFAATRSAFVLESAPSATDTKDFSSMIYTFLIAPKGLKLSALNRVRMVSCYASNLNQARSVFAGLSLALVCRKPAQGGSRHA
ncbi:hypothetical protein [Oceanospirillum linum]|uniref:Uncharacterized protein n=1 Tax=Oceanospirillum linum TaxID=966 RepID=A0A1T1H8L0_OCELI|nr:hypothetical protein [Oceanospirillum linum]OOV86201.1 hypothetical protein BTA35_0214575 [Oceanospirillum linum]SEG38342.1 hypothetical protein SAMN04489856_10967 [Oleiphilus messinensis]SMP32147.1 hypothetical protein SAMN06264348_10962 [Oceanospirillum linum]